MLIDRASKVFISFHVHILSPVRQSDITTNVSAPAYWLTIQKNQICFIESLEILERLTPIRELLP